MRDDEKKWKSFPFVLNFNNINQHQPTSTTYFLIRTTKYNVEKHFKLQKIMLMLVIFNSYLVW